MTVRAGSDSVGAKGGDGEERGDRGDVLTYGDGGGGLVARGGWRCARLGGYGAYKCAGTRNEL